MAATRIVDGRGHLRLAKKKRKKMYRYSAQLVGNGRFVTLENRKYLVFRMVPLVEGVHHGNGPGGRVRYTRREMTKYAPAWNHKPIVINHPRKGSRYVSADDPRILDRTKVGFMMRNDVRGGKQHAEAWIDVRRAEKLMPETLRALRRGIKIEVSTGLYATFDEKPGTWNGEEYDGTAYEFRPDHLAILPDSTGACSVADGCGMFQSSKIMSLRKMRKLQARISEAINGEPSSNCSCKEKGMKTKTKVSSLAMRRKKKRLVNKLSKLAVWEGDENREELEKLSIASLEKLITMAEKAEDEEEPEDDDLEDGQDDQESEEDSADEEEDDDDEEDAPTKKKKKVVAANKKKATSMKEKLSRVLNGGAKKTKTATAEEYIKEAPPEIAAMLRQGLSAHKANKKRYIDMILGNENNFFDKKELAAMELEQLQKLAALAVTNSEQGAQDDDDDDDEGSFNFAGGSGSPPFMKNNGADKEPPLELPDMDFNEKKSKKKKDEDDE